MNEINYSYINDYVEKRMENYSYRDKAQFIKKHMGVKARIENGHRNWVYNSFDYCCYTYVGLIESVKAYEEALDIKLVSRHKHKKVLAGITLWKDMDYTTQKKLISDRKA